MRMLRSVAWIALSSCLFAGSPGTQNHGPKTEQWNVICTIPKIYYMMLDIKSAQQGKQDLLSIEVAIDKETKNISYFSFAVPKKVDKSKGLTIEFTDVGKPPSATGVMKSVNGTTRLLSIGECAEGLCTVKINRGLIGASKTSDELDLLDLFLKHQTVRFLYWVRGHKVTAEACLLGFQTDYPSVLKELKENYH